MSLEIDLTTGNVGGMTLILDQLSSVVELLQTWEEVGAFLLHNIDNSRAN